MVQDEFRGGKILANLSNAPAFLYAHLRGDVAGIWRAGWRPMLGFIGCWVAFFAYYIAPLKGIVIDATATNVFLAMVFVQALGRGLEKHMAERAGPVG